MPQRETLGEKKTKEVITPEDSNREDNSNLKSKGQKKKGNSETLGKK